MEVFVARQPIFDLWQKVYGYELLFRTGFDNFYHGLSGDHTTAMTLSNSFFSIGIDKLTAGRLAFVNFTERLLTRNVATLFPKRSLAVEILPEVAPSEQVIAACKELKRRGYFLALDDFTATEMGPLLDYVDIVKISVLDTPVEKQSQLLHKLRRRRVKALAKKVETQEAFKASRQIGFSLFQGYFFKKPEIIKGREIPGYKLAYLKLLDELSRPELDYNDLTRIIKHDVSLSYKLLRLINSAFFGFHNEIRSIKHALALIGMREAKKWLSVIALSGVGKDKSTELVVQSLIRANLCELMAAQVGLKDRSGELFLMGLLSLVDAMLDQPMSYFLDRMPIHDEIKQALLGEQGRFRTVYEMVLAYEKADWNQVSSCAGQLDFPQSAFPKLYVRAIDRSNQFLMH